MKKYSVPTLNSNTPEAEQVKLETALKAVAGVEKVTLHPSTSQFEIRAMATQQPLRGDLLAASSKAGFAIASKK